MATQSNAAAAVDGVLLEWGAHLYYPRPKRAKPGKDVNLAQLGGLIQSPSAADIRARIAATVRRAPQAVVKLTGGGRGMKFIKGHLAYISKRGKLEIVDERGVTITGKQGLKELAYDWQFGGSYIPEESGRREAFHVMLSMPRGTDVASLVSATGEFAASEFADHKYAFVFHDHQANPHVHLVVRAESRYGTRLNPRKADLHRWRERFAQALRDRGIDAQATRQRTHGAVRPIDPIWRVKAREGARLRSDRASARVAATSAGAVNEALTAWGHVHNALARSDAAADRNLAQDIRDFLVRAPSTRQLLGPDASGRPAPDLRCGPQVPDRGQ